MEKLKNSKDLQKYFADKDKLVILKFYADWCNPCRVLSSMINKLTDEELKGASVVEINVDDFDDLCKEYQIRNIPVLFFMKDNMILSKKIGNISKQEFLETLNTTINK